MEFELLNEDVEYFSDIQDLAEAMFLVEDYFAEKYGIILDENKFTRFVKNHWSRVNVKGLDDNDNVKYKGRRKYLWRGKKAMGGGSKKYKEILKANGISAGYTPFDRNYMVKVKDKNVTIGDVIDERDTTKKKYKTAKRNYNEAKKDYESDRSKHISKEIDKQGLTGFKNILKRTITKHQLKKDYDDGILTLSPDEIKTQNQLIDAKTAKRAAEKAYTNAEEKVASTNVALGKAARDISKLRKVSEAIKKAEKAKERLNKSGNVYHVHEPRIIGDANVTTADTTPPPTNGSTTNTGGSATKTNGSTTNTGGSATKTNGSTKK